MEKTSGITHQWGKGHEPINGAQTTVFGGGKEIRALPHIVHKYTFQIY